MYLIYTQGTQDKMNIEVYFLIFIQRQKKVKPDLIVITGDLTNTKANMFPEQVDLTSEFLRNVAIYQKC